MCNKFYIYVNLTKISNSKYSFEKINNNNYCIKKNLKIIFKKYLIILKVKLKNCNMRMKILKQWI